MSERLLVTGRDSQGNVVTHTLDVPLDAPPPSGGFSHGAEITKAGIGPTGPLTASGSLSLKDGDVIENRDINGVISLAAGAHAVLRNCRIVGPLDAAKSTYSAKLTAGGGLLLEMHDCEVVTRYAETKGVVMWGDGNVAAYRTIFRGGTDNAYLNPHNTPGRIATGDADVPHARALFEDCWFGDLQRYSGSHSDCFQVDGGGYTLLRRCRIMSYNIPLGSDPLTVEADGSELASGGLILTQNSTSPNQLSHVALVDSWAEGGNYTVDMNPTDGLVPHSMVARGNRFGLAHRYGPLRTPPDTTRTGNVWGETGTTGSGTQVSAGDPL